jgi:hypothetical protein
VKPEHNDEKPLTSELTENQGITEKQIKEHDIQADKEVHDAHQRGQIGKSEKFLHVAAAVGILGGAVDNSSHPPVNETSEQSSGHTLKMSADDDLTRGEFKLGEHAFRFQTPGDDANIRQDELQADDETATFDEHHKSGEVTSDGETDRDQILGQETTVQEHKPRGDDDDKAAELAANRKEAEETFRHGFDLFQEQKFEEYERKKELEE